MMWQRINSAQEWARRPVKSRFQRIAQALARAQNYFQNTCLKFGIVFHVCKEIKSMRRLVGIGHYWLLAFRKNSASYFNLYICHHLLFLAIYTTLKHFHACFLAKSNPYSPSRLYCINRTTSRVVPLSFACVTGCATQQSRVIL